MIILLPTQSGLMLTISCGPNEDPLGVACDYLNKMKSERDKQNQETLETLQKQREEALANYRDIRSSSTDIDLLDVLKACKAVLDIDEKISAISSGV